MKYFKTITGYVAIDETTQVNANGSKIPTNVLAYGRGPERPLDAHSVAARVFDVAALNREGEQIKAEDVPNEWRIALGLVKVAPVCHKPAGETANKTAHSPEQFVTQLVCFAIGLMLGMSIAVSFPGLFK